MRLTERCKCGARIKLDGGTGEVDRMVRAWRRQHADCRKARRSSMTFGMGTVEFGPIRQANPPMPGTPGQAELPLDEPTRIIDELDLDAGSLSLDLEPSAFPVDPPSIIDDIDQALAEAESYAGLTCPSCGHPQHEHGMSGCHVSIEADDPSTPNGMAGYPCDCRLTPPELAALDAI